VHIKSPAAHGVRSVITARGQLVEARVGLDNTIRGLCATFGVRLGAGQGERFLARMRVVASVPGLSEAVASLLSVRERLVEQIAQLDRQLKAISLASPACQALMSIPGVGVQTSAAFAAAVHDAARFKRSRTAGAYVGLVPRRHQSGELDWTGRITKQGDGTVRKLLYEAANSILTRTRQSFSLKSWALKIAKRRGLRKARVELARRLAVIMHAMLRVGTLFEASRYYPDASGDALELTRWRCPTRERRDGRSAKVDRWAAKLALSQCNARPCETRYSTTAPGVGECGKILEALKGPPPSYANYRSRP
jgi:transposase